MTRGKIGEIPKTFEMSGQTGWIRERAEIARSYDDSNKEYVYVIEYLEYDSGKEEIRFGFYDRFRRSGEDAKDVEQRINKADDWKFSQFALTISLDEWKELVSKAKNTRKISRFFEHI